MAKKKLTVYQRLVRAAKDGRTLRLSRADVQQLGRMDVAISSVAELDDERDEDDRMEARAFAKRLQSDRGFQRRK